MPVHDETCLTYLDDETRVLRVGGVGPRGPQGPTGPAVGGAGLVDIPISTVEGDWDNGAGAWVFNGDGTVTSTDVSAAMTLPLNAAAAGAMLGGRYELAIVALASGGGVQTYFDDTFSSSYFGIDILEGAPANFINIWGDPTSTDVAPTGASTYVYRSSATVGVGIRNGEVLVVAANGDVGTHVAVVPPVLWMWNTGAAGTVVDLSACSIKVTDLS